MTSLYFEGNSLLFADEISCLPLSTSFQLYIKISFSLVKKGIGGGLCLH